MTSSRPARLDRAAPPAERDDATLANELRDDDEAAQREAWQRFNPIVRRTLARMIGPARQLNDDLTQETFLRFFQRVRRLRDPEALRSFVIGIAIKVAQEELRRIRVLGWLKLTATGTLPDVASSSDVHARDALLRLYAILDRLSAQDRALFVLRFVEELELKDVAEALGLSFMTTRRRVERVWTRVFTEAQRDPALVRYLESGSIGRRA
jgi:RNA polymerase sigma-70 factor (ECF subfamily)